jgi:hypothetical protein
MVMKKIVLFLVLAMSLPMMGQEECNKPKLELHKNRTEWFAQMRAKKLVFLVDAMDLTETEKAAFAVLFEKNETETGECYREMRLAKKAMSENPTEEEYRNAVEVARIQMLKIAQLRAEYLEKLEKIMSAEKIYKLYEAEEAYKKLLISDMGRCRRVEKK